MSEQLKNVNLTLVEGGHSPRDKNIKAELIRIVKAFVK